jgi:peptide/nickel transport system substrate-binding protein
MRKFALLVLVAVTVAACAGGQQQGSTAGGAAKKGGTLKVAQESEIRTLDPLMSSQLVEREIYYNMYDSLIGIDDKLNIQPQLATKWDISNPLSYVFTLRKGVRFHDGTDFNADAAKFNIDRILSAKSSPRKSELASVASAEARDPSTLVLHLKNADAALLAQLVDRAGMMLSPAAIQKQGADLGRNPVGAGTGPFQFVEFKRDDHLSLKKNPNYWRSGLPYLDQVVYRPITNTDAILAALRTGDIDVGRQISSKDVPRLKGDSTVAYRNTPGLSFSGIELNSSSGVFSDPARRKALAMAVDKRQVIKNVFFNIYAPSNGPLPPPSWAYDSTEKIYDKPDATNARTTAPGFSFNLKVTNSPDQIQEAQLIQSQLLKAGITANIQTEEFGQVLTETEAHTFDAAILQWSGRIDPDGNTYGHFHSGGGFNDGLYSNAAVDRLLEQARGTTDRSKRQQLYQEAQKQLVGDAPWVFIFHGVAEQITTNKVHNFKLYPDQMNRFAEVWKD